MNIKTWDRKLASHSALLEAESVTLGKLLNKFLKGQFLYL